MVSPRAAVASLLLVALVAGCFSQGSDDLACPPKNALARVESIEGTDVRVQVLNPSYGPAVLHTAGADFYYIAGDVDCFESKRELLTVGQEIEFFADAWMESYPPQAHVDAIIVGG